MKRRWSQFRLRSMFILTLIAAIYFARETSQRRREQRAASLINAFNNAMDERRYADAEVLAAKVGNELPGHPISEQLRWEIKLLRRHLSANQIAR